MIKKIKQINEKYFLAAGLAGVFISMPLYGAGRYNAAALFFLTAFFILLVFCSNKGAAFSRAFEHENIYTEKQRPAVYAMKFLITVGFILLSLFFHRNNLPVRGGISFAAALMQLLFLIKPRTGPYVHGGGKKKNELQSLPESRRGYCFCVKAAVMSAAFVLVYLSYGAAAENNMAWFTGFFAAALVPMVFLKTVFYHKYAPFENRKGPDRLDALLLIAIGLAAFAARYYRLLEVPPGILGDQTNGLALINRFKQGADLPIYLMGVHSSATLYAAFQGTLAKVLDFPVNIFTFKFIGVIAGTINVVFLYLLARELYTRRVAVISAVILVFMSQHLLFSRYGGAMIATITAATVCFYFYFAGMRRGSPVFMVISGVFLGLGIYFYTPGRVTPVIFVIYWILIFATAISKKELSYKAKMSLLTVFASVIVFTPLMDFVVKNPSAYFERVSKFNMLNTWLGSDSIIPEMINQFNVYFRFFFSHGSSVGKYNLTSQPAIDCVTGFFFILGSGYLLLNWRARNNLFILCWFVVGMLVGFLSGAVDLYPARIILAVPVLPVITALGINKVLLFAEEAEIKRKKIIAACMAAPAVMIIIYLNYIMFFIGLPKDPSVKYFYNHMYTKMAQKISKEKNSNIYYSKYYLSKEGDGLLPVWLGLLGMKGRPVDISLGELSHYYNNEGKDVLIIGESIYAGSLGYFLNYFPDARIEKGWNYNYFVYGDPETAPGDNYGWEEPGKVITNIRNVWLNKRFGKAVPYAGFVLCRLPYENVRELYGLKTDFYSGMEIISTEKFYKNTVIFPARAERAVMKGLVEAPGYGDYYLFVEGVKGARVFLDGNIHNSAEKLYKGLHRIRINMNPSLRKRAVIMWEKKNEPAKPIPVKYLIDSDEITGLMARYKDKGEVVHRGVEPIMQFNNFFYQGRPGLKCKNNICAVEWSGKIIIEQPGDYLFDLRVPWEGEVSINNEKVCLKEKYSRPVINKISLNKGKHPIKIETIAAQDEASTRLMYKKSGQDMYFPVKPENLLLY